MQSSFFASIADAALATANRNSQANPWDNPENAAYISIDDTTRLQLGQTVVGINVHAASVKLSNNAYLAAHFRLFLVLSNPVERIQYPTSVELNSSGMGNGQTRLLVSHRPYLLSNTKSTLGYRYINVTGSLTLREVLVALLNNGRHKYNLDTNSGSGCRHWTQTVLEDFQRSGWISLNAAVSTVSGIENHIRQTRSDIYMPDPAPQGHFF